MDRGEYSALVRSLGRVTREYVTSAITAFAAELAELRKQIAELPAGPPGPKGEQGDVGPQGERGETGLQGERGHTGTIGPTGERGEKGEPGESVRGETGPIGERGEKGEPGEPGPAGLQGERGERGESGLSIKGDPGEIGPQGERGEQGEPGVSIRGEKGDPGESIKGDKGDAGERGPEGIQGIQGERGVAGERGAPGIDGQSIHPDTIALMVANKVREEVAQIPKPVNGERGEPGRDAIHIEILPMIDPGKSYPRGTFGKYAGGTIFSRRQTDPITDNLETAGWDVFADGVADVDYDKDGDPRTQTLRLKLTSGREYVKTTKTPVMMHRGVWDASVEDYTHGDCVTHGGSTWHCQVESTRAKPGEGSSDWMLIVKRGRDGKDGEVNGAAPKKEPIRLK